MGDDEGIGIDVLRVSQLLTDEYSIKILVATVRQPKSAQDIAAKYGIPIAATYRRIKDLEKAGLLVCQERRLSQQGKRVSYYISMRLRMLAKGIMHPCSPVSPMALHVS